MTTSVLTRTRPHRLARGLAWFSIGLGLVELIAPRRVARLTGLSGQGRLVRGFGLRELLNGVGLLAARNPAPWLWMRVAGDALDLATLVARPDARWRPRPGLRSLPRGTGWALAAVAGVTLLDLLAAGREHRPLRPAQAVRHPTPARSGFPRPAPQMRGLAHVNGSGPAPRSSTP